MKVVESSDELIPELPEEIALECLTRLHYSAHPVSSLVCRRWRDIIQSRGFYYHRKQNGLTRKVACLVQATPVHDSESKEVCQPRYGISVFDPVTRLWGWVDPVPKYPDGLPLFCQVSSTEGKLIVMGGWNPANWDPVKDVFIYDFTTRRWTQCADMPSTRSFFAMGAVDGKVLIAGGHEESKNALKSAWIFDIKKNEWTQLSNMSEERDECEGIIVGSDQFWVVSGYDTESQGAFKRNAEVYELSSGEWRRVEEAWKTSQCPRSSVGDRNGELICWAESDSAVRVGACGVDLGNQSLVTGMAYQGAPHGFFLVDKTKKEGQKGKLTKIDVPLDFSGLVQLGCCVEI